MQQQSNLYTAFVFTLGFAAALSVLLSAQWLDATNGIQNKEYCAAGIRTIFSPGAQADFLREISSSTQTLDVMLYQFSNPDLMQALASAAARGTRVRIILEPRVDSNYATAEFLAARGVQVRFASKEYTNTHSKTAVIDARKVLVGSTNWSRQAMRSNRESTVVVESAALAQEFLVVFEEDWAKAKDFVPENA
ncbi:MAG TPA: phospholipase D family protein [Candidatus Norongarragalinales archaeon]|nr:phospholipase D family protein [Candidatus Norongarragalinales archaeon]